MKKKILVIDDEETIRKLMDKILSQAGYDVYLSINGEDDLEKLANLTPDLIMLDMNMPKMNWIGFLKAIKEEQITDIPVLMVSGTDDQDHRTTCYKLGVYDFIKKPEQPEVMLKRIENGLKIGEMIHFNNFIKVELMMAKKLQKYLYPDPILELERASLYSWSRPLSDIGGDIYDYIHFRDDRIMFIVADVTGHSISASLFIAIVKMVFRNAIKESEDPGEILTKMNNELSGNLPDETFVTIFIGVVDPAKSTIEYANAGHPKPFCLAGDEIITLDGHDSFLGPISDLIFETYKRTTDDLDAIYIFTDGIQDIMGPDNMPIGKKKMLDTLAMEKLTPIEKFQKIQDDLLNGEAVINDDCTVMLLQFKKNG